MKSPSFAIICLFVASLFAGCATSRSPTNLRLEPQVDNVQAIPYPDNYCGSRTGCISSPSQQNTSSTNDTVNRIFRRYVDLMNAHQGMRAVTELDSFFETLRMACLTGEAECRDACSRRSEMREYMAHWNRRAVARSRVRHGRSGVTRITYDLDIDPLCESHGNP